MIYQTQNDNLFCVPETNSEKKFKTEMHKQEQSIEFKYSQCDILDQRRQTSHFSLNLNQQTDYESAVPLQTSSRETTQPKKQTQ
jgi:hypothetical protein